MHLNPPEAQAILERRAAQLASAPAAARDSGIEVLEFTAAGQRCAIALAWLCGVRPWRAVALLPDAVAPVLGVAHVRGNMVPVLDPAPLLGTSGAADAPGSLLLVGRAQARFALAVQSIGALRSVSPDDVRRRSETVAALQPPIAAGLTADGLLLLDGECLLAAWQADGLPLPTATHPED